LPNVYKKIKLTYYGKSETDWPGKTANNRPVTVEPIVLINDLRTICLPPDKPDLQLGLDIECLALGGTHNTVMPHALATGNCELQTRSVARFGGSGKTRNFTLETLCPCMNFMGSKSISGYIQFSGRKV
jgi:hypothetical protein